MSSDYDVWHGETNIADWNAFGGNRPGSSHPRDYESMFDDTLSTYWVGYLPVTQQNRVVVTFKKPVEFDGLYIVTRPDGKGSFGVSYKSMCVVLEEINAKICTAPDNDVDVGQVIVLALVIPSIVTKVELVIQEGGVAQIADFKIHYKGTLT